MKVLGYMVAALLLILGVVGLLTPARLFAMVQFTTTPLGVYVAAGVRVAIGLILIGAAARSRFPNVLRVLGALALTGGLATLFVGTKGAQTLAEWVGRSPGLTPIRVFGIFALVVGSFIAYAISDKKLAQSQ